MLLQEEREQVIITAEDLNRPVYEVFKRVLDFVLSLFALVILLPVFLVTAAAVKSDGGNVIYKQKRVGKNNKLFDMYKFRSMCIGAENMRAELMKYNEMDGPVFKIKNDPRIRRSVNL